MNKNIVIVLVSLVAVGVAAYLLMPERLENIRIDESEISSFQECKEAGYPIMESYPERCSTPDGRTFTNEVNDVPVAPEDSGDSNEPNTPVSNPMPVPGSNEPEMIACTMDAMQCPDGSWVGRTGPNCEFVCPGY